jgi:uncharacterized heparinase superfamily protein
VLRDLPVIAPMTHFLLAMHTVRHLRLAQIARLVRNRLIGMRRVPPPGSGMRRAAVCWPDFLEPVDGSDIDGRAVFVGKAPVVLDARIDWRAPGRSKLWRYNLHYFDYLHWPGRTTHANGELMDAWIAHNAPGSPDAWEPYPISLRVVNWCKWFATMESVPQHWLASFAHQVEWLEANIEWHLLANHVFKNAKGILFGGLYLDGYRADRALAKGVNLLLEQAREQFLSDGGHYERSPMYHAIALEDLADCVGVIEANPWVADRAIRVELRAIGLRAAEFFAEILGGDGEIPLLNDSVRGLTREATAVQAYATRVFGDAIARDTIGITRIYRPDSGLFGYRSGGESLIVDCGEVGPDYQPGHSHADMLSFELCVNGRPIAVDSGTYDYEKSPLRNYLRSTAAHNTVVVDGESQSEVWDAFRVARRARPLYAELSDLADGNLTFRGAHDGYRRLPGRVIHERRITVRIGRSWDISDRITGSGEHRLESFIHLHPDCSVKQVADREFLVQVDLKPVVRIVVASPAEAVTERGVWCPEFGQQQETSRLVIRSNTTLPAELRYTLQRA